MDAERQALLEAFSDRVERAAVFEFVGAVGETETTLKTLDVCQGEDEYRVRPNASGLPSLGFPSAICCHCALSSLCSGSNRAASSGLQ